MKTTAILIAALAANLAIAQEADRPNNPPAPDRPLPPPGEGRPLGGERRGDAERPRPEGERARPEGDRPRVERERQRREGERPEAGRERPSEEANRPRREGERPQPGTDLRRPEGERPQGDRPRAVAPEGPNARPMQRLEAARRELLARVPQRPQPYLGIVTRQAGPDLAAQLRQPEGFGLVIEDVLPDSPAKAAGLNRNDLLLQFDDQHLANPPQLEALIRRAGKDKEATLTILRGGAEQKITIRVGEKVLPERRAFQGERPFQDRSQQPGQPSHDWNPRGSRPGGANIDQSQDGERHVIYARERARVVRSDEQGRYELVRTDGKPTFTATTPDGKVAWTGSVETEAERQAVPAPWREKLKLLEQKIAAEPNTPRPAPPQDAL